MTRVKKGVKVSVQSTKYFPNPDDARDYAIKALEAGVLFLEVNEWYEEVEDPEPVKPEPPKPEPKPEKPKRKYTKGSKQIGVKKKFTPAVDRY
ncbi:unnamed protein product, partial [marine sediment metagenome]